MEKQSPRKALPNFLVYAQSGFFFPKESVAVVLETWHWRTPQPFVPVVTTLKYPLEDYRFDRLLNYSPTSSSLGLKDSNHARIQQVHSFPVWFLKTNLKTILFQVGPRGKACGQFKASHWTMRAHTPAVRHNSSWEFLNPNPDIVEILPWDSGEANNYESYLYLKPEI